MFFKFFSFINQYKKETKEEVININTNITNNKEKKLSVYKSKIGGVPYVPSNFEFYKNTDGKYLSFFAQINLSELPKNNIFNFNKGIISFWLDPYSYTYGYYEENNKFKNYKVLYFEDIENVDIDFIKNRIENLNIKELDFIDNQEVELSFTKDINYLHPTDFRFEEYVQNLKSKLKIEELTESQEDKLYDISNNTNSKIGKNPTFVQGDFRSDDNFIDYEIDLFQYYSLPELMVGDGGIMHFLINKKDLDKKDFSKVLFYWDCY